MKPEILLPNEKNIVKCSVALSKGELVAFPTETVYGLGADATQSHGVSQIFELKKRPFWNPLIVHIPNKEWVFRLAYVDASVENLVNKLIDVFCPGPITFVLPLHPDSPIAKNALGGLNTIALRLPKHPVAQKLLSAFGKPIAAPSANYFQHVSPSSEYHVNSDFFDKKLLILGGGDCEVGLESTIVKVIDSQNLEILRKGVIGEKEIAYLLEPIKISFANNYIHKHEAKVESPGQLKLHYSPNKPVFLLKNLNDCIKPSNIFNGALVDFQGAVHNYAHCFQYYIDLAKDGNFSKASHTFYTVLRNLELMKNIDFIILYVPEITNSTLEALVDRMEKAAGSKNFKDFF